MYTYPQTPDVNYTDFFRNDLLDNYEFFNPAYSTNPMNEEFGLNYNTMFNEENCAPARDIFSCRESPASDHVFKFPPYNGQDNQEERDNTCVTQKRSRIGSKSETIEKHDITPAACPLSRVQTTCSRDEVESSDQIDHIIAPFRKSKSAGDSKVVRRDVINKTIFRIVRRYFLHLLEKAVPDYKSQKKDNLMSMLVSFADFLFPSAQNSAQLAEVMSALMFRRELLLSKSEVSKRSELKVFLDIQSKYSHKLLHPAMENASFRVLFAYFLEQGTKFFEVDENVMNNSSNYYEELNKIKQVFLAGCVKHSHLL